MRLAIGFAFIVLLAPGMSNAQELGASVFGGYSVPGDSRILLRQTDYHYEWDILSLYDRGYSISTDFHGAQGGLVIGGDFFARFEEGDIGIGLLSFSSGRISGALLSPEARMENVKSAEFERVFRSAFVFIRCRPVTDSPVWPYLGVGMGIYGLQESSREAYLRQQKGLLVQGAVGIEADLGRCQTGVFAELRLNVGHFDDDPDPVPMAFATLTVAIGLRFAY